MYFDIRLWRLTEGLRLGMLGGTFLGLLALAAGIARFAFLGIVLARVFGGAGLAEILWPLTGAVAAATDRLVEQQRRAEAQMLERLTEAQKDAELQRRLFNEHQLAMSELQQKNVQLAAEAERVKAECENANLQRERDIGKLQAELEQIQPNPLAQQQWRETQEKIAKLAKDIAGLKIVCKAKSRVATMIRRRRTPNAIYAMTIGASCHHGDLAAAGNPVEQFKLIPTLGLWQFAFVAGMIETYGEFQKPHYLRGGAIGRNTLIWDPVGQLIRGEPITDTLAEDVRAKKRERELANGRLAMIGAMGFSAHYMIEGSVPAVIGNY